MSVAYYQNTCAKLGEWTQKALFLVLGLFPVGFSVFATKNFGLSVLLSVAGYSCSLFGIWISVFSNNTRGFSDLVSDVVFSFPIHAIQFPVSSSSVYMPWRYWEECVTNLKDLIKWLHFSNQIMPGTIALQRITEGTGAKNGRESWEWKSRGNCGLYRFLMKRVKEGRILGRWINSGVNSTRKSEACKSLKTLFG